MKVAITKEDLQSYAEVDYVIKHMNKKYIDKIPHTLLTFFDTMKDPEVNIYINPYKPLQEQGLTKYALEIIALLHIKYWCEDKQRREELLEIMRKNQEKFENELSQKFNINNIFENSENEVQSNQTDMLKAYEKYMNVNPDIQDFTDLKEEKNNKELTEEVAKKNSLLQRFKAFLKRVFK